MKKGIIKGYILYRWDESPGELWTFRRGMDCSVNVATSLRRAGRILVEERLEKAAALHGLKIVADAREKTQPALRYLERSSLTVASFAPGPEDRLARDVGIAHKAFTVYGSDEPLRTAMQWLEPLSPILGWSGDDGFRRRDCRHLRPHRDGDELDDHLPVLMAGTEQEELPKLKRFDASATTLPDLRTAVSSSAPMATTWLVRGGGFRLYKDYWPSPERVRIAFGWSCCFTQPAHTTAPCAIDYARWPRERTTTGSSNGVADTIIPTSSPSSEQTGGIVGGAGPCARGR